MNRADALELTDALGQIGEGWWRQIAVHMRNQLYRDAGMTREEWVARVGPKLALPIEERRAAVAELTAPEPEGGFGLSQRQAADVLGVDHRTVGNDVRAGEDSPPVPASEAGIGEDSPPPPRPDPVEAEREKRLVVWVERIRVGLRTLAHMAGYPIPEAVGERLTAEEVEALRVVLVALEGGNHARSLG